MSALDKLHPNGRPLAPKSAQVDDAGPCTLFGDMVRRAERDEALNGKREWCGYCHHDPCSGACHSDGC